MKGNLSVKKFFASDVSYNEMTNSYKKMDGILAMGFYVLFFITYLFIGILYTEKHIYLGIPVNILLVLICCAVVLLRRQKLSTIGLTLKNVKTSSLFGLIFGVGYSLVNILTSLLSNGKLIAFSGIVYNIFYFFIIIAFTEEVVFRGFIQTRMYGLIKWDVFAVLVCGLMFSVMHIPFQMYKQNVNLLTFLQNNYLWLLFLVLYHFLFNFLYRKFNSLAAPILFHGFMNFSSNLFK
jgi:membrane protease YdiL (CAAX protease family)